MITFQKFLSEAIRPQPLSSAEVKKEYTSTYYDIESHGERFRITAEPHPSPCDVSRLSHEVNLPLTSNNFIEIAFEALDRVRAFQRTNRNTDQFVVLSAMLSLAHYVVKGRPKLEYLAFASKNDRLRAYRMVFGRLPYLTECAEWKNYARDYTFVVYKIDRDLVN